MEFSASVILAIRMGFYHSLCDVDVSARKRSRSEAVLEQFDESSQLKILLNFAPKEELELSLIHI